MIEYNIYFVDVLLIGDKDSDGRTMTEETVICDPFNECIFTFAARELAEACLKGLLYRHDISTRTTYIIQEDDV